MAEEVRKKEKNMPKQYAVVAQGSGRSFEGENQGWVEGTITRPTFVNDKDWCVRRAKELQEQESRRDGPRYYIVVDDGNPQAIVFSTKSE
jgi:hypothetical protein